MSKKDKAGEVPPEKQEELFLLAEKDKGGFTIESSHEVLHDGGYPWDIVKKDILRIAEEKGTKSFLLLKKVPLDIKIAVDLPKDIKIAVDLPSEENK